MRTNCGPRKEIGENGVDDGGDGAREKASSSGRPNMILGRDWVWPQPALPAQIRDWEVEQRKGPNRGNDRASEDILPQ